MGTIYSKIEKINITFIQISRILSTRQITLKNRNDPKREHQLYLRGLTGEKHKKQNHNATWSAKAEFRSPMLRTLVLLSHAAPCSKPSFNVPLSTNLSSWLYGSGEFWVRTLSFIFLFWGRICWGTKLCPAHSSQSRHESLLKLDPALNFAYVDLMYNICLTNGPFQKSQNLRCHDWWKIPSNPINTNEEVIKYENFRWINCHLVCYDVMNNGHLEFY